MKNEKNIKESKIERYFCKKADEGHFPHWKIIGMGCGGVPDQLIAAKGRFWVVELKRPKGGVFSGLQLLFRRRAGKQKAIVYNANTFETVDKFFKILKVL